MDMEYYRNFIAIAEAGSLSAASKRMHVAQSDLSNQLKLLQKNLGLSWSTSAAACIT